MNKGSCILTGQNIHRILDRLAMQVIESNYKSEQLVLVGIQGQGFILAQELKKRINSFFPKLIVSSFELEVDKTNPDPKKIVLKADDGQVSNKTVVLVDDVLNTGKTLAFAFAHILQRAASRIETAILINRSHTKFPVAVTYSGYQLSTTLDEHIEVRMDEPAAYLY